MNSIVYGVNLVGATSMSFNHVEVDSNGALRVAPPQELADRKSSHRFGGSATELSEMHEVCEPHAAHLVQHWSFLLYC